MSDKFQDREDQDKFVIEILTKKFTHDLVSDLRSIYSFQDFSKYKRIVFDLSKVKMIDSTSIGFLFEIHNKLESVSSNTAMSLYVGDNEELRTLLHKFQVDLLLTVE